MDFARASLLRVALAALLSLPLALPTPTRAWDGEAQRANCLETVLGIVHANNPGPPTRPLESIRKLRVATYNVLNFFMNVGSKKSDEVGVLQDVPGKAPRQVSEAQIQGLSKAIRDMDPDILFTQEVEGGIETMDAFNEARLDGAYQSYLVRGNDPRGINIGIYVKKDLPLTAQMRTHRDVTWTDPVNGRSDGRVFSRDLPVLILRDSRLPPDSKPLMILVGHHGKSKRDRGRADPQSNILRKAQIEAAAQALQDLQKEFGADAPIVFAGDMNTQVDAPEMAPLRTAGMEEGFGIVQHPPPPEERVTHTYHPRGGARQAHQMDGLFVSPGLRDAVRHVEVYRYLDENGRPKPLPETYQDREKNPSDHFPVFMDLDFQPVLKNSRTSR